MANTQQHPADLSPSFSNLDSAPGPKSSVPLPEDMADWRSTQQAADLLGCTRRQFQDFANQHKLPKKKVGLAAFYAPSVVEKARRDWRKIQAAKDAPKKTVAGKQTIAEAEAFSRPVAGDDTFYNQALSLIGQIVQQRGRLRR